MTGIAHGLRGLASDGRFIPVGDIDVWPVSIELGLHQMSAIECGSTLDLEDLTVFAVPGFEPTVLQSTTEIGCEPSLVTLMGVCCLLAF